MNMPHHNFFIKSRNRNSSKKYMTHNVVQDLKDDKKLPKSFKDEISMLDSKNLDQHSCQLSDKLANLKKNITELEVASNNFTEDDQILCDPNNFNKLFLHKDIIKLMSIEIIDFHNLNILNLSHNDLSELPDNLSKLKYLESLNVSYNKLNTLPDSYGMLQRLKYLDISNNKLNVIPKCIADGMGTLSHLNISKNIRIKMNVIPHSKYLEIFYAGENKNCDKFPDWILSSKFFHLKECNLDGTVFDIFSFIGKEGDIYITNFSMSSANLTNEILEEMIKNMINVEIINVGNSQEFSCGNMFNSIPIHVLRNPCLIKGLNFSKTSLPSVPITINQLINLKMLDLSFNCISWFPDEICELSNLEYLKISGNEVIMLPQNFGNLKLLRELRIDNNYLPQLPNSFKNLKNLQFLDLYNNSFEEFPDVLYEINSLQGLDLELNFFSTDNIKIEEISYSALYKTYASVMKGNLEFKFRASGKKSEPSTTSEETNYHLYGYISDDEENYNVIISKNDEIEENWDTEEDTDDEFDPGVERNYNDLLREYTLDVSNGFCPADLHSRKIIAEVACMRQYGSFPTYVIEQGQFDDA